MSGAPAATGRRHVLGTTPYAWPYDGLLTPSRLGLLIIGDAASGPEPADARVTVALSVLESAVTGAAGHVLRVATSSDRRHHTAEVVSRGHDGFFESGLDTVLRARGVDRLLLCGQWLETGVHSTLRSANDRGYECLLVADACRSTAPRLLRETLSMVGMSGGIFGAVGAAAPVVEALTQERGQS